MRLIDRTLLVAAGAACVVGAVAAGPAGAQQAGPGPAPAPAPQIVVSGSGEVVLPPAKAAFTIGVTTSAPAAATAGEDNARLSRAVLDALAQAGLKRDEIAATRLDVHPVWNTDDKGRRAKRSSFEAGNTIRIATDNLSQVGNFIDAALTAGATDVSPVEFSARDPDEARRRALGLAVIAARADAEAMARAGGGSVGELLLLTDERDDGGPGVSVQNVAFALARVGAPAYPTEVTPGEIRVTARVVARWRFVTTVKSP